MFLTNAKRRRAMLSGIAAISMIVPTTGIQAQKVNTAAPMTAKEKAQGSEAHPSLVAEFGGAMTGPVATYVETVSKNGAVHTGLSSARNDFTVTLLNSSVNNAFAMPGGFIYCTRQLMTLMNNEAELAAVMMHEVHHSAARHSAQRQKAATRNSIIGVLGTILSGVVLGSGTAGQLGQQLFSQGSQLLTLKYSRGQETESDNFGIVYMSKAGYDPRAMSTMLRSLANQNALDARLMGANNQVPAIWSTHPDPAGRVRSALAKAGANARGNLNRDTFLRNIDGLMYGDDPKQGVVEGRKFLHPELKLGFEIPNGFYMVNGTRSVSIGGQTGKGEFTGAAYSGDLDAYIRTAFTALNQEGQPAVTPASIDKTTVNGIPAAYGSARVQGSSGQLDVVVFAYEFSKTEAFHFLIVTSAGNAANFNSLFSSMRRLSASEAAAVKPRRIELVTTRSGDTLQSLANRMAYDDAKLERFLVLNALTSTSTISAGQKLKIVAY